MALTLPWSEAGRWECPTSRPNRERSPHPVALFVIVTGQLMVTLDATVVNVALLPIRRTLGFSPAGLDWVIDAYSLAFGGFFLLGGRVGDAFGRRGTLCAGIGLFTAGSLAAGLAPSPSLLLAGVSHRESGATAGLLQGMRQIGTSAGVAVLTLFAITDGRRTALLCGCACVVATFALAAIGLTRGSARRSVGSHVPGPIAATRRPAQRLVGSALRVSKR